MNGLRFYRPDTWDEKIFKMVYGGEYGKIDFMHKTVVDIGAHIGGFSVLAAHSGSSVVHAYEASPENYYLLSKNCDGLPVILHNQAVWRSDGAQEELAWVPSRDIKNTGGGVVTTRKDIGVPMDVVSFDSIVESVGVIDILKLDCEGSEIPILMTSKYLHSIELIVGEYHRRLFPETDWSVDAVFQQLRNQGFLVTNKDSSATSKLGKFTAKKK